MNIPPQSWSGTLFRSLLMLILLSGNPISRAAVTVVQDTFDIGTTPTRNDDAADSSDLQWWSVPALASFTASVPATANTIINDGKALFGDDLSSTNGANTVIGILPALQTLGSNIGDELTLSCDIGIGSVTESSSNKFYIGLYNSNGSATTADAQASSNDDFGYIARLPFGSFATATADVLKETGTAGTMINGTDLTSLTTGTTPFYYRTNGGSVHLTLTLTRTYGGDVIITFSVKKGTTVLASTSVTNSSVPYSSFNQIVLASYAGGGTSLDWYADNVKLESSTQVAPLTSQNVAVGGGGASVGIQADLTTPGRFYMRTDMGGAYRWEAGATQWTPISDTLSSANSGNDFGPQAIAIDPNHAGTIYMYAGKAGSYLANIYKSTNAGDTWVATAKPANLRGNTGTCRMGEKMQVDPNDSNVLYLASENVGLWKSTNGAASWTQITAIPAASDGLSFVAFDKGGGLSGSGSAVVYVGVRDSAGNGGVWKTTNGGGAWAKLAGGFTNPFQGRVASDGTLYVTFNATNGVCKVARNGSSFVNIPPSTTVTTWWGLGVGSGQTIVVGEGAGLGYGMKTWFSTNGGTSWTLAGAVHGIGGPARDSTQWFGHLSGYAMHPGNNNEVWMSDWLGVLRTQNISDPAIKWDFISKNHEEIVPLALRCAPSGAPLISGAADVNGMRHPDITQNPPSSFPRTSGTYNAGATTGLDFCESNPNYWVRVGLRMSSSSGYTGYTSSDNGATWTKFPSFPSGAQGGRVAMSASNPNNIVWKAENGTFYTLDGGVTWTAAVGAAGDGVTEWFMYRQPLFSNRVTNGTFYMLSLADGNTTVKVYQSTNGGANWSVIYTVTATTAQYNTPYTILSMPGNANELWFAVKGVGLYKSVNGGTSFTQISGMTSNGYLGIGKAAPGHTNLSLIMNGGGPAGSGHYISDDDGTSWRLITTAPRVANVYELFTADRQTYGRFYIGSNGRGIYVGDAQ